MGQVGVEGPVVFEVFGRCRGCRSENTTLFPTKLDMGNAPRGQSNRIREQASLFDHIHDPGGRGRLA